MERFLSEFPVRTSFEWDAFHRARFIEQLHTGGNHIAKDCALMHSMLACTQVVCTNDDGKVDISEMVRPADWSTPQVSKFLTVALLAGHTPSAIEKMVTIVSKLPDDLFQLFMDQQQACASAGTGPVHTYGVKSMDSQDALRPDPTATPAATPEATPEEIRESYLRGLVTEGASGPRRTVSRSKAKGKSKPKKTSGRQSAASMPAEEDAAEELLAEIEHEREQCEEECPLCFEIPGDACRMAPCAGGHRACRGCWMKWRAESVKCGHAFCCPLCRECLEGWEP